MDYLEIVSNIITYLLNLFICLKTNCNNQYMNGTNLSTLPTTITTTFPTTMLCK